MPTAIKPHVFRLRQSWHTRAVRGKRFPSPWFVMEMFNELHPMTVLEARLRHWKVMDEQHAELRGEERELLEKSLASLPEDLRWLASRLEIMLEQGYKPVAD